jgi:flagellin
MGLRIGTNLPSLTARRNLEKNTRGVQRSIERLSSGLRLNSARDDAAGLSISSRMTAQIRALGQAVRNTNDGISLSQTAEGALQETTAIISRVRELAIQAANDTNSDFDRQSLQEEVTQLVSEVDRIATETTFNGGVLLDGRFLGARLQVGANAREEIALKIDDARAKSLGRQARETSNPVDATNNIVSGGMALNSVTIRATIVEDDTVSTTLNAGSAIAKAKAINDSTAFSGVTAIVEGTTVTAAANATGGALDSANFLQINGERIVGFTVQQFDADGSLRDAINARFDETGVIATLDQNFNLQLTAEDGRNVEVEITGTANVITGLNAGVTAGTITLQSDAAIDILYTAAVDATAVGDIGGAGAGTRVIGVNQTNSVATVDLSSRAGAQRAIDIADVALDQVTAIRASLGAVQNRLISTADSLSITAENLSAARSRIVDADFAVETAELTRSTILQTAGVSVLAQSNSRSEIALALLQ